MFYHMANAVGLQGLGAIGKNTAANSPIAPCIKASIKTQDPVSEANLTGQLSCYSFWLKLLRCAQSITNVKTASEP